MGCGASAKGNADAPYIHQYFVELQKCTEKAIKQAMDDPMAMIALAFDPAKVKEMEETKKKDIEKLIPLIEKSFDNHDKNRSGTLDKAESALFFKHFVSENTEFNKAIAEMAALKGFEMSMKMMKQMAALMGGGYTDMKKEAEKEVRVQIAEMKKQIDGMAKDYADNKEARDAAAFKVIDVNGDGQIQRREFVPALTPETPHNMEFLKALGFDAATAARSMQSPDAGFQLGGPPGADPECVQQ